MRPRIRVVGNDIKWIEDKFKLETIEVTSEDKRKIAPEYLEQGFSTTFIAVPPDDELVEEMTNLLIDEITKTRND